MPFFALGYFWTNSCEVYARAFCDWGDLFLYVRSRSLCKDQRFLRILHHPRQSKGQYIPALSVYVAELGQIQDAESPKEGWLLVSNA